MKKVIYFFLAVIFIALGFFGYRYVQDGGFLAPSFTSGEIEKVAPQAFGSFTNDELQGQESFGRGGGGGGGGVVDEDSMIAPEYTSYKYVYNGTITLPTGNVLVLKRVKGENLAGSLVGQLARLDFDLADISALQDSKLQSFNLVEDRDFGYSASVIVDEGSVSINQNWNRWPDPYRVCSQNYAPDCYENLRLKESDMLSDNEVLSIAADFVQKFGINLDSYKEPQIAYSWREDLARYGGEDFYFPESASVVYPLAIDNKEVLNQGGSAEGINVTVDQRNKKVSGVWGLSTQNYQASDYPAVADETIFRRFLAQGGLWGWTPENAKIVEVSLGDPTEVLMKYWKYDGGESQELLLPALSFPILEKPADSYIYQDSVVIPLVAEVLTEQENNMPIPEPLMLEMEEEEVEAAPADVEAQG